MQIFVNILLIVQILSALLMIGVVLLQHGKGADMGASFGSGASGSLFGATGSANVLSRITSACATVFFLSTLGLAYYGTPREAAGGASSVLERSGVPVPAASAAIPGAAVPSPAASAVSPAGRPGEIPRQ